MNEFAMFGVFKGTDSERMYNQDVRWPQKSVNKLLDNDDTRNRLYNEYKFEVPITSYLAGVDGGIAILTAFILYVFCLLIFLAYIVSN